MGRTRRGYGKASSAWMMAPQDSPPHGSQPSPAFLLTDAPASSHVSPDQLFGKSCEVALWPLYSPDLQGNQLFW